MLGKDRGPPPTPRPPIFVQPFLFYLNKQFNCEDKVTTKCLTKLSQIVTEVHFNSFSPWFGVSFLPVCSMNLISLDVDGLRAQDISNAPSGQTACLCEDFVVSWLGVRRGSPLLSLCLLTMHRSADVSSVKKICLCVI